jgi:hypothetical protein
MTPCGRAAKSGAVTLFSDGYRSGAGARANGAMRSGMVVSGSGLVGPLVLLCRRGTRCRGFGSRSFQSPVVSVPGRFSPRSF